MFGKAKYNEKKYIKKKKVKTWGIGGQSIIYICFFFSNSKIRSAENARKPLFLSVNFFLLLISYILTPRNFCENGNLISLKKR